MLQASASIVLIVFLGIVFSLEIPFEYPIVWITICLTSSFSFLLAFFHSKTSVSYLSASLHLLPFFGNASLSLNVCAWCLGRSMRMLVDSRKDFLKNAEISRSAIILLISFFLSFYHTMRIEFDYLRFYDALALSGPSGAYAFFLKSFGATQNAMLLFSLLVLCLIVSWHLGRLKEQFPVTPLVIKGMAIGGFISALICFAQVLDVHQWFSLNRGDFWLFAKRYEGAYTDPNAFGAVASIALPLFLFFAWSKRSYTMLIASVIYAAAVFWTGSRTFFLSMIIWIGICVVHWTRSGNAKRLLVLSFTFLSVLAFLLVYPASNHYLQSICDVPGVLRVLKTLDFQQMGEMLSNRLLFAKIAWFLFLSSPMFGIGLSRFYGLQDEASASLGISLGSWRDNANNFYLQILSEQGLMGLVLLVFVVCLWVSYLKKEDMNYRDEFRSVVCYALCVFGIVLVTGPHFLFYEVSLFFTLLLSAIFPMLSNDSSKSVFFSHAFIGVLLIVALLVFEFNFQGVRYRGFHQIEQSQDGEVAWTGGKANIQMCGRESHHTLIVQAPRPDISVQTPLRLEILSGGEVIQSVSIINSSPIAVSVPRDKMDESKVITLSVERVIQPSTGEGDSRILGVMVKMPASDCFP